MSTFGSLFSGIGGFDLGFERAGMACNWQVEIDEKCQDVLTQHWPGVEKHRDVREARKHNLASVDVVCGGFPCQDLSVAGKRAGLAGERSGLWYEFHRIVEELRPGWVVVENVPGLLSSNAGRDFAVVLHGLVELGYGVCWRVLDAQYFGLAQRRRRVFVVASLGSGRAAEVLFEREGGSWDTAPSREAGTELARPIANSSTTDHYDESQQTYVTGALIAFDARNGAETGDVSMTLQEGAGHHGYSLNASPLVAFNAYQRTVGNAHSPLTSEEKGRNEAGVICWHENKGGSFTPSDHAKALRSGASHSYQGVGVRRLTPVECERLQGFPDGWTFGSDSTRYRQLGNAVAVPVAEWVGKRIVELERLP